MKKIRLYWISFQFLLLLSVFGFAFLTAFSKENLMENKTTMTAVESRDDHPVSNAPSTLGNHFGQQVLTRVNNTVQSIHTVCIEHCANR